MNDTTIQPVDLEPVLKTPDQLVEELKAADIVTVDLINETKAKEVALQSAPLEAAHTFRTINGYLNTLRAAYETVVIDTTTTAGLQFAKDARFKLKTLRTRSEKLRVESNDPFAERIKAHNDAQKMVEDAIRPLEQRFDDAIKAQERAVAQRKIDEEAAATLKAANITAAINGISARADDVMDLTAAELAVRIQEVTLHELSEEELGARFSEAVSIKDRTIAKLEAAHAKATTNEANALQVEEDRKRHETERAAREKREGEERKARDLMNTVNEVMADAPRQTIDELDASINGIKNIDRATFEPLRAEGDALVDRVLPALRTMLADKVAAAEKLKRDTEAAAKREKEDNARTRIAAMKATVADAVGATSASIAASIEAVNALLLESFEPFAKEAEQEQGRVLTSLEKLRAAAASDERTTADKKAEADRLAAEQKAKAERAQQIADRIALIDGSAARAEARGDNSKTISGLIDELVGDFNEAAYGDRAQEAGDLAGKELVALRILFTKVKAAEDQAEHDRLTREENERLEREQKESESRLTQAILGNAASMHLLLMKIRASKDFSLLNTDLRNEVIHVLVDIDQDATN